PDSLVVGFARRAATYKRADLILGKPDRLRALLDKGVALVFSGKSHPRDERGRSMVASLVAATRDFPGQVVFLENYDMLVGALLTRGCDIWLNNPRRPKEACGTSGMKAAMNGVPNCSILDGWWPEGCEHGVNGWQIKADYGDVQDEAGRDELDRDELYRVMEEDVLTAWNDQDKWLDIMLASIRMSQWQFSSDRMVQDYYDKLYRLD
ncbi:MAG: alpha-glucan family phosphorylase, partial [Deltaproteobacteria bacterium]|nr:alpha-glucan family phosphorylase [Deltaproteobacteria bacterium]